MSTPKQVVYTPVDIDDADYADFEHDPKMEAENAEFDAFKSEMHDSQDDAKITVGKKLTDSRGRPLGKQVFECFECGIDDYTFSQLCTRIREDFGTGLYMIQGRNSKGAYKFRKTVGILAPNQTDNPPAPGTDIGALIDKFSDAMQRQQMQTEQMFAKLAGPQTGGDAFGQMTAMVKAMGSIFGAIGLTPQQPKTLLDQLTEYKMMKELFGDGENGGESNLFSLLTETVKSFGPALGAAILAQQKSGAIPASGPIQAALPQPQPETEKQKMDEQLISMKPQIDFLVYQATEGATPDAVANVLLPKIPDEALESIEAFLQQENCLDLCAQVNAGVNQYRQWFIEWRQIMLNAIQQIFEDEPGDEAPPGGGEIIGPEPLTSEAEGEQTSGAVAGDQPDTSISATAEQEPDTSDVSGAAAGDSGDAPNA